MSTPVLDRRQRPYVSQVVVRPSNRLPNAIIVLAVLLLIACGAVYLVAGRSSTTKAAAPAVTSAQSLAAQRGDPQVLAAGANRNGLTVDEDAFVTAAYNDGFDLPLLNQASTTALVNYGRNACSALAAGVVLSTSAGSVTLLAGGMTASEITAIDVAATQTLCPGMVAN